MEILTFSYIIVRQAAICSSYETLTSQGKRNRLAFSDLVLDRDEIKSDRQWRKEERRFPREGGGGLSLKSRLRSSVRKVQGKLAQCVYIGTTNTLFI